MSDRGVFCMMVGYNTKSGEDVFRMRNLETSRIHCTSEIIWLKKYFYTADYQAGENEEMKETVDTFDPQVMSDDEDSSDSENDDEISRN
eukprot:scaffold1972_cov265-Chaetoceros_neogracile.AAC.31